MVSVSIFRASDSERTCRKGALLKSVSRLSSMVMARQVRGFGHFGKNSLILDLKHICFAKNTVFLRIGERIAAAVVADEV